MANIDTVRLNFDPGSLTILSIVLGFVMFGVALDVTRSDLLRVAREPRAALIGLSSQFVLLPALTYLLTRILDPPPSIALGMILVSACPGGNLSNFFTNLAGGRTALSIGMTAVSTCAAVVMTPLNLSIWGGLHPGTRALLQAVGMDPVAMLVTILLMLAVPLVLGIVVAERAPAVAARLRGPLKTLSIAFFLTFVVVAFHANLDHFVALIAVLFAPVAIQNALALGGGYGMARFLGLSPGEARAVSIETGIQNSGLGLILVFDFFDGLGGMAVICGWWGIWHIVAGMALAAFWSRRPLLAPGVIAGAAHGG
ncbi:MAG: symporter [Deltaproteobacteria bacterium]|nr:symporter [Deltaproteobacteria bacterium]